MITVGRTSNNDVVIPSPSVSRFHAYFELTSGRLAHVDAGSRVGTWVASKRLQPRDVPLPLASGDIVRFADETFLVLNGVDCWNELRRRIELQISLE
jgi:pSer/pThr/pTyr-binding forkhead associated (FHA) protein